MAAASTRSRFKVASTFTSTVEVNAAYLA